MVVLCAMMMLEETWGLVLTHAPSHSVVLASREDVYYHVIYRVFGLRGGVSPTTEIDGGWLTRRNSKNEKTRLWELLTTKAPWCNWNLFGQIFRARESRLVALDATMLPQRTRLLLNEDWDLYESLATCNSRRLYEEMLSASVRPRQAFAGGGRTPVNISLFDQFTFSLALYALASKRDQEHHNRYVDVCIQGILPNFQPHLATTWQFVDPTHSFT